jgi:hypothetical protein
VPSRNGLTPIADGAPTGELIAEFGSVHFVVLDGRPALDDKAIILRGIDSERQLVTGEPFHAPRRTGAKREKAAGTEQQLVELASLLFAELAQRWIRDRLPDAAAQFGVRVGWRSRRGWA